MNAIFERTASWSDMLSHYCPGCGHGITQRLIAEVIDEMGLADNSLIVTAIGCSGYLAGLMKFDAVGAPHGRAPAVATGVKRVQPDATVFAYQGDGDLSSIGCAEIIHAANRGEKFTVIYANNANYGMTGGQMAPTTLVGQVTATSPLGRDAAHAGYPLGMAELLATLPAVKYAARTTVYDVANINKTKKAIRKAFEVQAAGLGFSIVEVLSQCPTNWGLAPTEAVKWVKEKMVPVFPLGEFKTVEVGK